MPEATGLPLDRPVAVARSRSPALAARFGIAVVAVAAAVVGWVLFGDTNPDIYWGAYWPVQELMPAAIAFSIGRAVLFGYPKARWPAGVLLICALLAGGRQRSVGVELRQHRQSEAQQEVCSAYRPDWSSDLQPAPVDNRGLEAALTEYIATLDAREAPRIQFRADLARSLPTAVEQGAYLVVLEALNNVVSHAHATHCEVSVTLPPGELVVRVVDDGVGLGQPYVSGIGITSMRSRVQALGGTFDLGAAPGGGTLLQARIPVEP